MLMYMETLHENIDKNMEKLTKKEIHGVLLGILEDVDRFCKENGLRYSMAYGTLLGAVRHKGFIPWDDDIDILMPRKDYLRFRETYRSDKFIFLDSSKLDDCFIAFGRVCDTERTMTQSYIPWHGSSIRTGVWIDIFPLDSVPDDAGRFLRYYSTFELLLKYNSRLRKIHAGESDNFSTMRKIWDHIQKLLNPRLACQRPEDIVGCMNELISMGNSSPDCHHLSQLTAADNPSEKFDEDDFTDLIDIEFEGREFRAPARYDKILTMMYGNYMELPPENKRVPKQKYIKFFRKDRE